MTLLALVVQIEIKEDLHHWGIIPGHRETLMSFWGTLGKVFSRSAEAAVSGPAKADTRMVKSVTGAVKDLSDSAKDVTGIRTNLVETTLDEKTLAEKGILIAMPTLEDVQRYDRNLHRFKKEWEADKARQANGSDIESWLSARWLGLITSLFVLIVLFLCLWYLVKTVLQV